MGTPFVFLCIQTLVLWLAVIFLHRLKHRFTLIPLYAYLAVLALLTHNLSDLGFSVVVQNWFFLISSFSFFTTLMLGIFFLYLFEGPRATRLALYIILGTSILYISIVGLLSFQVDTSNWIFLTPKRLTYYFWSLSAIIVDVFFITIFWEVLGKIKKLPFFIRIFLVIFTTFSLDTLIFVSGVFGSLPIYTSILKGDILTRFIIAIISTPIIFLFLKSERYSEEERVKPKSAWEILNFHSDLEAKILSLEDVVKEQKLLQKELSEAKEKYLLALEGANAGIWEWDIVNNHIMYSKKFLRLLGYDEGELLDTIEVFKEQILHPEDLKNTFELVDLCFSKKTPLSVEFRLKTKEGSYKWFLSGGIVKFDGSNKPIRMVGSIIDIDEKKKIISSYEGKVAELEKMNNLMVGRELHMHEMKVELRQLRELQNK